MRISLILLGLSLLFSCKEKQEDTPQQSLDLGEINIEVSGSDEALPAFKDGLLLLHSFEYKDALEKFKEAQEIDPDFAMAYWGEAMCLNHPLWREQEYNSARDILLKLGADTDEQRLKFKTEFEKDMFDGLNILYGSGPKPERDLAYAEHMAKLHEKYPDNDEITAFYALSLLGSVKGGRDFEVYEKGAKIAQSLIDENPNHPGALHYLIHSYDDPNNAHKALEAANNYSKLAPDAGHALHMPSHIYVALGMWDEVISSNIDSWEASKKRKSEKELDNDALNYHAFKWLMYGYLQQANYDKARSLVEEMQGYCYEKASGRAVDHLVMMKAAYFTETNSWDDELFHDTINYEPHSFTIRTTHEFLEGMRAYHQSDVEKLKLSSAAISSLITDNTNIAITADAEMCSGSYNRDTPTQLNLDRAKVLQLELDALSYVLEGDDSKAEDLMKEAVALEQNTSYNFGPPQIVKPSSELYAEWLIQKQRIEEAMEQLDLVLKRAPGRYIVDQHKLKLKELS